MTQELKTPDKVIEALGGVSAVASMTGRKYTAAWNWTKAPHFPANTYIVLTDELRKQGKSAPSSLWRMGEAAQS